jgi:O-antigen ligase
MSQPLTLEPPEQRIAAYVAARAKSPAAAFVLALVFGPLGSLYAGTRHGLIMIAAALVLGAVTGGAGALVVWVVAIFAAPGAASEHNERVRTEALLLAGGPHAR